MMSLAQHFRRKDSIRKETKINEEIKEETELEYGDGYRDDDSDLMSNDFDVINLKDPEGPMKQIH
jgi:hypothetical protein